MNIYVVTSKMARRVYFSFHFERDAWRAGQVRNSWVCKPDREAAGFDDAAAWEEVQRQGDDAIKRWINENIQNTSVTVVLIGTETSQRRWVRYEIEKSLEKGNTIVGIDIHNVKDQQGKTCLEGDLDFGKVDGVHTFSEVSNIHDWVEDNGYDNIGDWVETSAQGANRKELGPPKYRYTTRRSCGRHC